MNKCFVAYYYFVGWDCISLGFHLCCSLPNIEIHLPFGFIRIGWAEKFPAGIDACWRSFGIVEKTE